MLMNDIVGLGKVGSKIVSILAEWIGARAKPERVRNEADAEAYRLTRLADAMRSVGITEYADIKLNSENPLERRAFKRIIHEEARRQENIEQIFQYALEEPDDEPISDEPPTPDFITRFFNYAPDA